MDSWVLFWRICVFVDFDFIGNVSNGGIFVVERGFENFFYFR